VVKASESSTPPTWLARFSRSVLVGQRARLSSHTAAVAEGLGEGEPGAHGGAGAGRAVQPQPPAEGLHPVVERRRDFSSTNRATGYLAEDSAS
jgi:hypothetical protein